MAIKMRLNEDGTTGPVAVCDSCGKIVKANDANVTWVPDSLNNAGDFCSLKIACTEYPCLEKLDKSDGYQYTMELALFMTFLIKNSQMDVDKANEHFTVLDSIGLL